MSRTGHHVYRRKREALKRSTPHHVCHLCGEYIDLSLHHSDPMSWSADHVDAVASGGSNNGTLMAAHRGCNSKRRDRSLDEYRSDVIKSGKSVGKSVGQFFSW